jgi:hypothetical protein
MLIAYYEDKYNIDMGDVQKQAMRDAMDKYPPSNLDSR